MSNSFASFTGLALAGLLLLFGCKPTERAVAREYPPKSEADLIALAQNNHFDFQWFSAKISADARTPERSNSFRATLRIRKDSAIWVSVSPAMGIEAFRLLCTRDSVKYLDKLKNQYFLGTYKRLNELTNSDLDLQALQDILVGDPLYFDAQLGYRARKDETGYLLSTRNANRLRRIVGTERDESLVIPADTSDTDLNERRLNRLQDRWKDEDLIVRQYWFDYDHGKVVQSVFTDLGSALYLSSQYSTFEDINGQLFPTEAALELGNTEEQATFKLDYSRIKVNVPAGMPFSIPSKYEPVQN